MLDFEVFRSKYEFFFSKVTGFQDFHFNPTEQQKKIIHNFILLLDAKFNLNTLGDNFINDYFAFQFSRKYDRKTRFGKGIVPLNHVLGKKALEEWNERDEHWNYFVNEFLDKFKISFNNEKYDLSSLTKIEEEERKRFFNKDEGFANCIVSDILFSKKSSWCIVCKFKSECKKRNI